MKKPNKQKLARVKKLAKEEFADVETAGIAENIIIRYWRCWQNLAKSK